MVLVDQNYGDMKRRMEDDVPVFDDLDLHYTRGGSSIHVHSLIKKRFYNSFGVLHVIRQFFVSFPCKNILVRISPVVQIH